MMDEGPWAFGPFTAQCIQIQDSGPWRHSSRCLCLGAVPWANGCVTWEEHLFCQVERLSCEPVQVAGAVEQQPQEGLREYLQEHDEGHFEGIGHVLGQEELQKEEGPWAFGPFTMQYRQAQVSAFPRHCVWYLCPWAALLVNMYATFEEHLSCLRERFSYGLFPGRGAAKPQLPNRLRVYLPERNKCHYENLSHVSGQGEPQDGECCWACGPFAAQHRQAQMSGPSRRGFWHLCPRAVLLANMFATMEERWCQGEHFSGKLLRRTGAAKPQPPSRLWKHPPLQNRCHFQELNQVVRQEELQKEGGPLAFGFLTETPWAFGLVTAQCSQAQDFETRRHILWFVCRRAAHSMGTCVTVEEKRATKLQLQNRLWEHSQSTAGATLKARAMCPNK